MRSSYRTFEVAVAGATVLVGKWGDASEVVVASHGITANHLGWQRVAELVVERSNGAIGFAAIDHRGRAGSAAAPGSFGMAEHADDLIAVADHLGIDSVTFAGHSMGGFVVASAAERHGARVERLVLVDGGLPFPIEISTGADIETIVQSVIGPALDRLDKRWPDEDAYVDFFRAHPAFQPPNQWSAAAEAYVRHDVVVMSDGSIRSSANKDAVLVDGAAVIVDPESASPIERILTPTTLLWAPRGVLDRSPGLYSAADIADAEDRLGHLNATLVDDTNHYTIQMSEHGASAVADAIIG